MSVTYVAIGKRGPTVSSTDPIEGFTTMPALLGSRRKISSRSHTHAEQCKPCTSRTMRESPDAGCAARHSAIGSSHL
jgi:hypothetical protein